MAWTEPIASPQEKLSQWTWFGLWLTLTGFGLYLTPSAQGHGTHQQLGLPPCPTVLIFNRPCPGCGMTTSWTSLLHGNFVRAFQSNLIGPVFYALFTFSALFGAVGALNGFRLNMDYPIVRRGLVGLMIVFFSYAIFRFATAKNYAVPIENQYADYIGVRPAK